MTEKKRQKGRRASHESNFSKQEKRVTAAELQQRAMVRQGTKKLALGRSGSVSSVRTVVQWRQKQREGERKIGSREVRRADHSLRKHDWCFEDPIVTTRHKRERGAQ